VTERDASRLIAWNLELGRVHKRLGEALNVTREALATGRPSVAATRDLLLLCQGFCTALDGHHRAEDHTLFPAIEAAHPELRPALRALQQDHSMIAHLLRDLAVAAQREAPIAELSRHLEGIAAIMESHFRYEEHTILQVLESLSLAADPKHVLGPF